LGNIRKTKYELRNKADVIKIKASTFFSKKKPVISTTLENNMDRADTPFQTSPNGPANSKSIPENSVAVHEEDVHVVNIVFPPKVTELKNSILKMKLELDKIKTQMNELGNNASHEEKLKHLRYLQRGMFHEQQDLIQESCKLELLEFETLIAAGHLAISIGDSQDMIEVGKEFAVYPINVLNL
jgi:hypothetical protein